MIKKMISSEQLADIVPYSQNQLRRLEAQGRFPKRVRIGPNRVAWVQEEIERWFETRMDERNNKTEEND